jgi:AraC-like DNA-binding protein
MSITDFLISAGLANAILLAIATGVLAGRNRGLSWLCAFFCIAFVVTTAIVVSHHSIGVVQRVAVTAEQLGWALGPVAYLFVRTAFGYPNTYRGSAAHFIVPIAILVFDAPFVAMGKIEPLPSLMVVLYQMAYTTLAAWLFFNRPVKPDRSAVGYWWPLATIVTLCGVHVAQIVRLSQWRRENADIVPAIGSIGVLCFVLIFILLAQRRPQARIRYAKSSLDASRAQEIFLTARALLVDQKLYRHPDLMIGDVAVQLQVGVHHLSQAIAEAGGTSFPELLCGLRVEDAMRLLREPRNAAVAVEPIGMEAGFRSRSAFYAAFGRSTGLTPAQYRDLSPIRVPPGRAGHGR